MVSSLYTDLSYDEQMQPCASPAAKPFTSLVVSCVAKSVSPQKLYVKFEKFCLLCAITHPHSSPGHTTSF